ncbi:Scavenger receptor Cys-rich [Mactra antiquata]
MDQRETPNRIIGNVMFVLMLLTQINFTVSLTCLKCDSVQNITDCHGTTTCQDDESCFTDTVGAGGNTRFTLGCRSKDICRHGNSSSPATMIGRAIQEESSCSQCCGVDECNRHTCSSGVHGLHTSQCTDDPGFNCAQVSSLFNVCSDKDHAKLVCRKFCDLCDIIDGYWLEWSNWSICSETCGNGTVIRTRACNRTEGGLPCTGDSSETQYCQKDPCPINGGWSSWNNWAGCAVTCGIGLETRGRFCSNPYPDPFGRFCPGDSQEERLCWATPCLDGNWSAWSAWSTCTATCQGGLTKRTRQCDTSYPGHNCDGHAEEYKVCNRILCTDTVVDGGWSQWTSWSNCSVYCMSERTRTCSNPAPSLLGKNCLGSSLENKYCNQEYCSHPVRLVNGSDPYIGRLEVFHNGEWGTVCSDAFDSDAAEVVCRMLNYEGVARAFSSSNDFGEGTLSPLLSGVDCIGSEKSLFDCVHTPWAPATCQDSNVVAVSCHSVLELRLVNGTARNNGLVEISRGDGNWSSFCYSTMDIYSNDVKGMLNIAPVVCRMLSLPSTNPLLIVSHQSSQSSFTTQSFLTDIFCSGTETNLSSCQHSFRNLCPSSWKFRLACLDDIHVRLNSSLNKQVSRVEIFTGGNYWDSVCGNSFVKSDARMVCEKLGLPTNITIPYGSSQFGQAKNEEIWPFTGLSERVTDDNYYLYMNDYCSTTAGVLCGSSKSAAVPYVSYGNMLRSPSILDSFHCKGTEMSVADCDIETVGDCRLNKVLKVDCLENASFDVRLVNGSDLFKGIIEASFDGTRWGHISPLLFDNSDARVVCRMLGLPTVFPLPTVVKNRQVVKPNILGNLACNGTETTLINCPITKSVEEIWFNEFTEVLCGSDFHIRLVNGTNNHNGRVELSVQGNNNKFVTSVSFGKRGAMVICRMLKFPTNVTILVPELFGKGPPENAVQCNGSENSLNECHVTPHLAGETNNNYNLGLQCAESLSVRLVNRTSANNGRVEALFDGTNWVHMCRVFRTKDAQTVCRTLGLPSNAAIGYGITYSGIGVDVGCGVNVQSLTDCTLKLQQCRAAAGVWCIDKMHFRLMNGTNMFNGRIEVSFDGTTWGQICDDYFSDHVSEIMCNTLGLPSKKAVIYKDAYFGQGTGPYLLATIRCSHNSRFINDCDFFNVFDRCGSNDATGIWCKD